MPTITAETFSEVFSGEYIFIYLAISVLNTVMMFLASGKFLLAFQQCRYQGKSYLKWFHSKQNAYFMRLVLLVLMAFLFFTVLAVTFSAVVGNFIASFIGFISYVLFVSIYINTERYVNAKVHIVITHRLTRLCITYILVLLAFSFGAITLLTYIAFKIKSEFFSLIMYAFICLTPLFAPYLLSFSAGLNLPFELLNNRRYIERTREQLKNTGAIKIGITGSYGKTSVKNILATILGQKYRVLCTPESYNTPLGIARTVKKLDATHDVFIAEMGARHIGDISDLALLVKPQYAVLTGVSTQHLETFGTEERIKKTKFELFETLDKDGLGFFTSDNEGSNELYDRFNGNKYRAGVSGGLVTAEDISLTETGVSFTLVIEGEKPVKCNTKLLGKHNISNICLASAVAYKLGLTIEEIANGISRLTSVGHRLELVTNNRSIKIIDDSYNASIDGTKAAMEVLSMFGGRKIVLTPGIVELGKAENLANYNFGRELSKVADIVIVIGKHNAEMLIKGLQEGGMGKDGILFAKNLAKGNELLNGILKEGDVVLFENDLPDTYN